MGLQSDPQTGDVVWVDDGQPNPALSDFASPSDAPDASPDPAGLGYLQNFFASRNPEERASMSSGLNYTPDTADPHFHDFTQNLMTANEQQPQIDKLGALQDLLTKQFPAVPDAPRHKTPALAYILGGLQDALALGSQLRRGRKVQYYTGRHGAGHKPVMGHYYENPRQVPTQFGGTATALFAPQIRQQHEQDLVDRQNFARQGLLTRELAQYAGSPAMRQPAPPRPSAFAQALATVGAEQDKGTPGFEGARQRLAAKYLDKQGSKLSLAEEIAAARANGDTALADRLLQAQRDISAANRTGTPGPKTTDQIAAEAEARTRGGLSAQLGFAQDQGVLTPNVSSVLKRARSVGEAKVSSAQRTVDALTKQQETLRARAASDPFQTGDPGAALDEPIRKARQSVESARWEAQQAEDQARTNLKIPFTAGTMSGVTGETGSAAATGDDTPAMPPGFDMQFSDGSHFSEWTDADWTKLKAHSPETYDQLMAEIDAAPHGQ